MEGSILSLSGAPSSYHIREAGATAVQKVAFTLANAIAYVAVPSPPSSRRTMWCGRQYGTILLYQTSKLFNPRS